MMNIVAGKGIFYIDVTLYSGTDNSFVWSWKLLFIHSFIPFTESICTGVICIKL